MATCDRKHKPTAVDWERHMNRRDRVGGRSLAPIVVLAVSVAFASVVVGGAAGTVGSAERTLGSTTAAPGEQIQVTVDVRLDGTDTVDVIEKIEPAPANLAVESDDGALISTTDDGVVLSSWGEVQSVTLVYTVTVPENASDGQTFVIDGTAMSGGGETEMSISGNDTITVETRDGPTPASTATPGSDQATPTVTPGSDRSTLTATTAAGGNGGTPTATPGSDGPGFGILVAVLAVLAATARRRS